MRTKIIGMLAIGVGFYLCPANGMYISSEVELFEMLTNTILRSQSHTLGADITYTGYIDQSQIKDLLAIYRQYSFEDFTGTIEGNGHTLTFSANYNSLSGGTFRHVNFSGLSYADSVRFENCTVGDPSTEYLAYSATKCQFVKCRATKGASICHTSGNDYYSDKSCGSYFEECEADSAPIAVEAFKDSRFINCHTTGPITLSPQINTVVSYVGGIVGKATGCELDSCSWDGGNSYSVQGTFDIGGIVGSAEDTKIFNCKCVNALVKATGGSCGGIAGFAKNCDIAACSYGGTVVGGGDDVGGLVGTLREGTLADSTCEAVIENTGEYVGGAVGKAMNVQINNVIVSTTKDVGITGGKRLVGGFVGSATAADITRCAAKCNVTAHTAVSGERVHAYGGFVGECTSGSSFKACSASGNVVVPIVASYAIGGFVGISDGGVFNECCATGAASGGSTIAGFAGSLQTSAVSSFENCFATGSAEAIKEDGAAAGFIGSLGSSRDVCYSVKNCFAAGGVKATSSNPTILSPLQGGLSPVIQNLLVSSVPPSGITGTATASFWDTGITGMSVSGLMGEGKTHSEMMCQCTYSDVGWNFNSIWEMTQLYPRLRNCNPTGKSSNVITRNVVFEFSVSPDPLNYSSSTIGNYCTWSVDGSTWHENDESVALETGLYTVQFKSKSPLFENPDSFQLTISASDDADRKIHITNPTRNTLRVYAITDSPGCGFDESRAHWYIKTSNGTATVPMMNGDATRRASNESTPIAGGYHLLGFEYDAPSDCEWDWRPVVDDGVNNVVYVPVNKGGNYLVAKEYTCSMKFRAYAKSEFEEDKGNSGGGAANTNDGGSGATPVFSSSALTYNSFVLDESGALAGTLQIKATKANKKTGESKVTATYQPVGGKKVSLKGGVTTDGKGVTLSGGGMTLVLNLTATDASGTLGGLSVSGSVDTSKSKDKTDTAVLAAFKGKSYAMAMKADGYVTASVTFSAKGKAKVSGTLPDGTKISVSSLLIVGSESCSLPVAYSKKSSLGFVLKFDRNGNYTGIGGFTSWKTANGAVALEAPLVSEISNLVDTRYFNFETLPSELSDAVPVSQLLPVNVPVTPNGSKWSVPKAAKVSMKDGVVTSGENPAAVKLTYAAKTGTFKGSCTLYTEVNGRLKKHSTTLSGIVVGGVGYGSAIVKKEGSFPIVIGNAVASEEKTSGEGTGSGGNAEESTAGESDSGKGGSSGGSSASTTTNGPEAAIRLGDAIEADATLYTGFIDDSSEATGNPSWPLKRGTLVMKLTADGALVATIDSFFGRANFYSSGMKYDVSSFSATLTGSGGETLEISAHESNPWYHLNLMGTAKGGMFGNASFNVIGSRDQFTGTLTANEENGVTAFSNLAKGSYRVGISLVRTDSDRNTIYGWYPYDWSISSMDDGTMTFTIGENGMATLEGTVDGMAISATTKILFWTAADYANAIFYVHEGSVETCVSLRLYTDTGALNIQGEGWRRNRSD